MGVANIALYDGHTWYTPAHPLLQGTKRAELLDNRFIVEFSYRIKYFSLTGMMSRFQSIIALNNMIWE